MALIFSLPEPLSPSPTFLSSSLSILFAHLYSLPAPPLSSPSPLPPPFISLPHSLLFNPPPLIEGLGYHLSGVCSAIHHLRSGQFKLGLNLFFSPTSFSMFQFRPMHFPPFPLRAGGWSCAINSVLIGFQTSFSFKLCHRHSYSAYVIADLLYYYYFLKLEIIQSKMYSLITERIVI